MEWKSALKYASLALMAIGALGPAGSARTREIAFTGALNALLQKKQLELEEQRQKEQEAYRQRLLDLKERELEMSQEVEQKKLDMAREAIELEQKRIEETQKAYAQIMRQLQGGLGRSDRSVAPFQPPTALGTEELFPLPQLQVPKAEDREELTPVPPFDTLF